MYCNSINLWCSKGESNQPLITTMESKSQLHGLHTSANSCHSLIISADIVAVRTCILTNASLTLADSVSTVVDR